MAARHLTPGHLTPDIWLQDIWLQDIWLRTIVSRTNLPNFCPIFISFFLEGPSQNYLHDYQLILESIVRSQLSGVNCPGVKCPGVKCRAAFLMLRWSVPRCYRSFQKYLHLKAWPRCRPTIIPIMYCIAYWRRRSPNTFGLCRHLSNLKSGPSSNHASDTQSRLSPG